MTFPPLLQIATKFPLTPWLAAMHISQGFGEDLLGGGKYAAIGLKGHNGWDLRAKEETEVFAPYEGIVYKTFLDELGGNILIIKTPAQLVGDVSVVLELRCMHLKEFMVHPGQEVTRGQKIALSDTTGKYCFGAHLHGDIRPLFGPNGEIDYNNGFHGCVDPTPFFSQREIDELPVDRRYGKSRSLVSEIAFAKSPVTRLALKRLPNNREINAAAYGGWTIPALLDPAMFTVWSESTVDGFQAEITRMKSGM